MDAWNLLVDGVVLGITVASLWWRRKVTQERRIVIQTLRDWTDSERRHNAWLHDLLARRERGERPN